MQSIIEFVINEQKPLYLKQKLDAEYEKSIIIKSLKFLGLNSLVNRFYSCQAAIDGFTVIYDVKPTEYFNDFNCVLSDGSTVSLNRLDKTKCICRINLAVAKENSKTIWFKHGQNKIVIERADIIDDIGGYFMSLQKYCDLDLHVVLNR